MEQEIEYRPSQDGEISNLMSTSDSGAIFVKLTHSTMTYELIKILPEPQIVESGTSPTLSALKMQVKRRLEKLGVKLKSYVVEG